MELRLGDCARAPGLRPAIHVHGEDGVAAAAARVHPRGGRGARSCAPRQRSGHLILRGDLLLDGAGQADAAARGLADGDGLGLSGGCFRLEEEVADVLAEDLDEAHAEADVRVS